MSYYLRTNNDPILRTPSRNVTEFNKDFFDVIKFMHDTILENRIFGIDFLAGLAAPQIGSNLRIVTIIDDGRDFIYVNPRIIEGKGHISWNESCLSYPGLVVHTTRYDSISVEWCDFKNGKTYLTKYHGRNAVVLQHEIDHLDGIVIADYGKRR